MKRNLFILLFLGAWMVGMVVAPAPRARAQAGSAYDLIAEVNALRSTYGLPPLEVNANLMAAAQSHSDYQAAINSITHSGPGGSRPHDRAVGAGYGGGAQVFISENIAGGVNLSVSTTVYNFWSDDLHMNTMINPQYRHIGAGVSFNGDWVFYTIDVGFISGQPGSNPGTGSTQTPGKTATKPVNPAEYVFGVQTATPNPDGSVVHVVRQGQSLWSIATAYGIKIDDILRMNKLAPTPNIWPGDKLVIAPTYTPTVAPTETVTPVPPTETPQPTRTPLPPTATPVPSLTPTQTPAPLLPGLGGDPRKGMGYAILGVSLVGLVLVILGGLRRRS